MGKGGEGRISIYLELAAADKIELYGLDWQNVKNVDSVVAFTHKGRNMGT